MKRTYIVLLDLGTSVNTGQRLFTSVKFERLWKASKFARAFESQHSVPSFIIDTTDLQDAYS